ncbi:MAG: hypothetical protein K0S71_2860 [Clostridia bacterium]|jgi:DNA-binding MarR family transcriptional regulator|nr:hypothetical protein [Clostridia bacterium]
MHKTGNKSIGRLISILHRQSQIYLNIALKDIDISSSEYVFLITLLIEEGISQDELSARILIDKAATARAIKSLEDKGYVRRETDSNDKRIKKVYCTHKAKECESQIRTALASWTKLLTEDLSAETEELIITTLEHMSSKVRSIDFKELLQKE